MRIGQRRIPGRTGLVFGQRPVGCPEPQCQGQRLTVLPHLRAGVDVEEGDILEQVAGSVSFVKQDAAYYPACPGSHMGKACNKKMQEDPSAAGGWSCGR